MGTTWVTKRNDLLPVISGTILNADGTPVDLTGSTLTFLMRESQYPHNLKVNAAATITSALAGTWSYTWVAGDTNTAGLFQAELEATFPSGKPETFPSRGYIMVLVDEDVDITDVPDAELVTITDLVNALVAVTTPALYAANSAFTTQYMPFNGIGTWIGNVTAGKLQSWQWGTTDRLSIAFIGDSLTLGAWAGTDELTEWYYKGFVGKFRQAFQRIYGNGGYGFVGLGNKQWVKAGTWTQIDDYIPFGQCWWTTSAAATWTLTTKAGDGDNFDLFYIGSSNAFTYTIDGGAPVTITPSGGVTTVRTAAIALPSDGAHTVVVFGPASGTMYFCGAALYKGTGGCVVHNIGRSGAAVGDMGFSSGTSATKTKVLDYLAPRLSVIGFIANDYNAQTALTTYTNRLGWLVDKCVTLGDTVVWCPPDNGITPVKTIPTETYEDTMKAVAVTKGIPWVDIHLAWGDYTANASKMYDTQHPNEAGHNDIAAKLLHLLRVVV